MNLAALTKVLSLAQIRSAHEAQHSPQIALWSGAVSSGKTIASLLAFLIALAAAPDRGLIVIVGRTLQTIERNIIDPLMSVGLFGIAARHVHHTTGSTIATILGRQIHLIGANDVRAEGRIRGATIALAYVDEATLVPQTFWMMLLSRLRVSGAKLLATTNPDGPGHWLRRDFILRADAVGMRHWHFTLADNPSLDQAYVERLKRQYVGLWHRRFIDGDWCLAEGAVFDMWDEQRHVIGDRQMPAITRWISLGIDYGTVNPTHAVLLALGVDRRLYLIREWRHDSRTARRQMTNPEYSTAIRRWLTTVPIPTTTLTGVIPERTVIDPSATQLRVQLHRDGLASMLADNSVLPGIQTMAGLFALDLLLVHESLEHLRNELPGYSWDPDAAMRGEDKPIKADDHGIDGARYAVHSTRGIWRADLRDELQLA